MKTPCLLWCELYVLYFIHGTTIMAPPYHAVLGELGNVVKVFVLGVISVHGDDLVVTLALVKHLHHTDGLGAQEAARLH